MGSFRVVEAPSGGAARTGHRSAWPWEAGRGCGHFSVKVHRQEEGKIQKCTLYLQFHLRSQLGDVLAELIEELVVLEGGLFMVGPAPRGPFERDLSKQVGVSAK